MPRAFPLAVRTVTLAAALAAAFVITPAIAAQQKDSASRADSLLHAPLAFLTDTAVRYGLVPRTFSIYAGGFLPTVSTSARLSSSTLPGTDVNFETALGLSGQTQNFEFGAAVRLGDRQLITLGVFQFTRAASRTITDSIAFGDTVYHPGATLQANNGLKYIGLTYQFYIWRHLRWELGAGLGVDAVSMTAGVGLKASLGGPSPDSVRHSGEIALPAPMLGVYGDWEFQPRFFLRGRFEYLYINSIASIGGWVSDDRLSVEWYPLRNYGVGAAYHYIGVDVTKTYSRGEQLNMQYTINGPAIYVTAAF
jgi:hypothetical protein